MNRIIGVYQIKNKINQMLYIGSSSNVQQRWKNHKQRYKDINSKEYNKKLYQAIREYGIDNFEFSILEECSLDALHELEKYYINLLETEKYGYNISYGYENHNKALLNDIRERYNNKESKRSVYKDYETIISKSGFHKIWNNYTWIGIMPEVYTEENKLYHKNDTGSSGELNPRTKLSNEDIICIRAAKDANKNIKEIYQNYKNKIKFNSFQNIWYGYNWKTI